MKTYSGTKIVSLDRIELLYTPVIFVDFVCVLNFLSVLSYFSREG